MARRKEPVAGRDFQVDTKPRSRARPKPTVADVATSAYVQEALSGGAVPVVEPAPSPALEGEIFPPLPDGRVPQTLDEFVARISDLWESIREQFLRIGELMVIARERLSPEDQAVLRSTLDHRYGRSARSQIVSAYEAIAGRVVPREMAAAGYGTVYMLARLTDEQRQQAAEAGLLRPDVRQADVSAFCRQIRTPKGRDARRAELEMRRARLMAEVRRIDEELARLRHE